MLGFVSNIFKCFTNAFFPTKEGRSFLNKLTTESYVAGFSFQRSHLCKRYKNPTPTSSAAL